MIRIYTDEEFEMGGWLDWMGDRGKYFLSVTMY